MKNNVRALFVEGETISSFGYVKKHRKYKKKMPA